MCAKKYGAHRGHPAWWVCPELPEHRYAKPGHCEDCGKTLVEERAELRKAIEATDDPAVNGEWLDVPVEVKK